MDLTADAVNTFIADHATETHIEALYPASKRRRAALDTIRVTSLKVGSKVIVENIRPKYLAGLKGTLVHISAPTRTGRQKTILCLDEESTEKLRKHQWIPKDETEHQIDIIPLIACYPLTDPTR
ncbi:hypothetical protein AB0F20_29795 [Streptomyces goshikiensis]|uniref:hypothetical protein n=1 Tax=Streptomyces goshikiensis TaxID=1942 RepID=UPI0033D6E3FF